MLVVGMTGLLLLAIPSGLGQTADPAQSVEEATGILGELLNSFTALMPRLAIALALMLVAWVFSRTARLAINLLSRRWARASATATLVSLVVWLLALGSGLSVIAGDARALVGSVGLVGLALSWALQGPIESFSAWLLNSFRSYYVVGDRIAVGEVMGDVFQIDILTTTVWEIGGPGRAVQGAQPTGALVTFPNSEILRANVSNFTRDFPWVWDEVTVTVAEDSHTPTVLQMARQVSRDVVGDMMQGPATEYAALLAQKRLAWDVSEEPQVFLSGGEFWHNLTVRYLVPARERRRWASALYEALANALSDPAIADRARPAAHRVRLDGP